MSMDKALRKIDSRLKHSADERLANLRVCWEHWTEEQRQAFKKWIVGLAEVNAATPAFFPRVKVSLTISAYQPEIEESFEPPIEGVRRAIECWERGEHYAPTTIGEMI
jgi:hypothetical protein